MNNALQQFRLNAFVKKVFADFQEFMEIKELPSFKIEPFNISPDKLALQEYGVPASHHYDPATDKHTIRVWQDIYYPVLHADYHLFHEFTHLYDAFFLARGDKYSLAGIKAYTEYHAGQVDFLKLLNVQSISKLTSFSLDQVVETYAGPKTALEYVINSHEVAKKIMMNPLFPESLGSLNTALGMVHNYLGRASICKMYAVNFSSHSDALRDFTVEDRILGAEHSALRSLLYGFPERQDIMRTRSMFLDVASRLLSLNPKL